MSDEYEIVTPKEWAEKEIKGGAQIASALEDLYRQSTLYERLDSLINLVDACNKAPKLEEIQSLKKQAEAFIGVICNTHDIENAIQLRKDLRDIMPNFIPNTSLRYLRPPVQTKKRKEVLQHRITDHLKALAKSNLLSVNETDQKLDAKLGVKMFDLLEREPYRIIPGDGLLWQLRQPNGEERLKMIPFDTKELVAHSKNAGTAIFVLNPQGELFAGSSEVGVFHHSSFQKGGLIYYGGTMKVTNGKVKYIDDYSGHYTPKIHNFFNVLKELKNRKLINPDTVLKIKFTPISPPTGTQADHKGIKVDSEALNALGFLGLQQESKKTESKSKQEEEIVDPYDTLRQFLYENVADENSHAWKIFALVMREYLSDKKNQEPYRNYYGEITALADDLGIEENFADEHPDLYNDCLLKIKELIQQNPSLNDRLGDFEWMPELKKPSI